MREKFSFFLFWCTPTSKLLEGAEFRETIYPQFVKKNEKIRGSKTNPNTG